MMEILVEDCVWNFQKMKKQKLDKLLTNWQRKEGRKQMTKSLFESYINAEPTTMAEKYIFLIDNQDLVEATIVTGHRALLLIKNKEHYFDIESFVTYLKQIEFSGKYEKDLVYVPACLSKALNDKLKEHFEKEYFDYYEGWKLFKNCEYLCKLEHQKELKKKLEDFIGRFEGTNISEESTNNNGLSVSEVMELLTYKIDYDKDGNVKGRKLLQTVRNFEIILQNDFRLKGRLKFNEFSSQEYLVGSVPWDVKNNYRAWNSHDDSALFSLIQSEYGMTNRNDYFDAIKNVCVQSKFHPIKDILGSLVWDGKEHIKELLPNYLGVENTDYTFQVMRLFLLGAINRIYQPGCKFDYAMILQGKQGLGKSTFLRLLALNDEWFSDSLDNLDSDKAVQSLMGSWIIELAELKALARTGGGIDSVKRFLSATQDKYRQPYARRADIFLRQCIFCGTTNKSNFLCDETGNRRFLIVQTGITKPTKNLFCDEAINDIRQAWAEAMHIYKNENPKLVLPKEFLEEAERLQAESEIDDGKTGIIEAYLKDKNRTCAIQIWREALGELGRPQKYQAAEINTILDNLEDWERMKSPYKFTTYGSQRGFQRKKNCSQNNEFKPIEEEEMKQLPF